MSLPEVPESMPSQYTLCVEARSSYPDRLSRIRDPDQLAGEDLTTPAQVAGLAVNGAAGAYDNWKIVQINVTAVSAEGNRVTRDDGPALASLAGGAFHQTSDILQALNGPSRSPVRRVEYTEILTPGWRRLIGRRAVRRTVQFDL